MQKLLGTPHMPPFALFEKIQFSEDLGMASGTLWQGPWGPGEVKTEKNLKILEGLEHTLGTPHMPPFALFEKSVFGGKRKSSPGGWVRSKWKKNLKILDRLGQTLLGTPHMPTFTLFEKSWFSEV